MKLFLLMAISFITINVNAQGILHKIKYKTKQKADSKTDQAIDKALDKTDEPGKKKNDENNSSLENDKSKQAGSEAPAGVADAKPASFKTYANYDVVPGNKIIFEDNFSEDADREFPTHWKPGGMARAS